jgi:hypothetical protein
MHSLKKSHIRKKEPRENCGIAIMASPQLLKTIQTTFSLDFKKIDDHQQSNYFNIYHFLRIMYS